MPTILIVDDSPLDRRLAGGVLERAGDYEVAYAASGREALEQIATLRPDVIVTDLIMPELDGWELVTAVRREHPLIPIVLMTARGNEQIAVRALRQGAASYVPKRRLAADLVGTLEQVLAASHEDRSQLRLLERIVEHESRFELENDLGLISSLVEYLQQGVSAMRIFDPADRVRVGVAVQEALVNAYFHGNLEIGSELRDHDHKAYYALARERATQPPYRDRRIRVEFRLSRAAAVYVIADEGPGFDPRSRGPAAETTSLESAGGRGLVLMQTFMDEVTYNDRGNEVTMVKRRTDSGAARETGR